MGFGVKDAEKPWEEIPVCIPELEYIQVEILIVKNLCILKVISDSTYLVESYQGGIWFPTRLLIALYCLPWWYGQCSSSVGFFFLIFLFFFLSFLSPLPPPLPVSLSPSPSLHPSLGQQCPDRGNTLGNAKAVYTHTPTPTPTPPHTHQWISRSSDWMVLNVTIFSFILWSYVF